MANLNSDVSENAFREYERDGFTVFRNVLDPELIAESRSHIEWLAQRYPELRPEHYHHPLMRDDAFWVRLVTDSRLLDIAELFVGPNIACFTSHYICKPALDGHPVLWHQDGSYWDIQPMRAVALWLAVDRSEPENGCLRMLPGTHREPLLPLKQNSETPNMLASSVNLERHFGVTPIDVVLDPGDVSVHHPHIIHGSEPNQSRRRRCGLDIGYMPTSARICNDHLYQNPIFVRGRAPDDQLYQRWPEVRAGETIGFRGDGAWNEQVAAHNENFQRLPIGGEDPLTMTKNMMQRLASGTVKTRVGSPSGGGHPTLDIHAPDPTDVSQTFGHEKW